MFIDELRPVGNPRGWRLVGDVCVCPACERRSVYSREHDRFFHCDGSANIACWVRISSGELVPRPIVAGGSGGGDEHQAAA
jgi:hypothetical protein